MVEHKCNVDVVDIFEHLEEAEVLVKTDALHNDNNNNLISPVSLISPALFRVFWTIEGFCGTSG